MLVLKTSSPGHAHQTNTSPEHERVYFACREFTRSRVGLVLVTIKRRLAFLFLFQQVDYFCSSRSI